MPCALTSPEMLPAERLQSRRYPQPGWYCRMCRSSLPAIRVHQSRPRSADHPVKHLRYPFRSNRDRHIHPRPGLSARRSVHPRPLSLPHTAHPYLRCVPAHRSHQSGRRHNRLFPCQDPGLLRPHPFPVPPDLLCMYCLRHIPLWLQPLRRLSRIRRQKLLTLPKPSRSIFFFLT